jgi:hypothetical protein
MQGDELARYVAERLAILAAQIHLQYAGGDHPALLQDEVELLVAHGFQLTIDIEAG